MSDTPEAEIEQSDRPDKTAHRIEEIYNAAIPDHAPELSWDGIKPLEDGRWGLVFDTQTYADDLGLGALKERGFTVEYIETIVPEEGPTVLSIVIPDESGVFES